MDQGLDRVRQFARAVRSDLAARPEPAGAQAARLAGVRRSGLLGDPAANGPRRRPKAATGEDRIREYLQTRTTP